MSLTDSPKAQTEAASSPGADDGGQGGRVRLARRVVADLTPAPYNPREITDAALAGLGESISRFGVLEPIVVNERTGRIVGGHQRARALEAEGITETDVVLVDLDEAEEKAANLALNHPGIAGEFTADALPLLREIESALPELASALRLPDLQLDLEKAFPAQPGDTTEDEAPEPPDEATTRAGDLWELGDHRLLCGDSGSAEDLDRLLDGAPIHLLNTDPPYNVKVEPRSNNAIAAGLSSFSGTHHQSLDVARHPSKAKATHGKLRAKDRPLENDFVTDEAFAQMLRAWFNNAARVLQPGRGFYIWGGYANVANYPSALVEAGLYFSQAIIWHKLHPVLTRKDFMGDHEWCFYGWREGAAHVFLGPQNVPDVWPVKKVNPQSMVHLTEKPVELAARAMKYSSRPGEHVLDLFGGSGSTLAAAEQLDRRAFLMELDPLYCDVIVERWEKLTGGTARRLAARK